LPKEAVCFEFGAWMGRNALPILESGRVVWVQDSVREYLDTLLSVWRETYKNSPSPIQSWENLLHIYPESKAQECNLDSEFDALLCIRLLHFLSPKEGQWLIHTMQSHTKLGWFNALSFFTADTLHNQDFFFPTIQTILEMYQGWEIYYDGPIVKSEATTTTNGRVMVQKAMLFKKK
jgi:hypothetical protein